MQMILSWKKEKVETVLEREIVLVLNALRDAGPEVLQEYSIYNLSAASQMSL